MVDRSLIVTMSDQDPGGPVTIEEIVDEILPAMVDDIHLDNKRKQELHEQLDLCGV